MFRFSVCICLFTCESAERDSSHYRARFFGIGPRDLAHARQNHRRVNVVGPDAMLAQLDCHGSGDLIYGPLGRAVRSVIRNGSLVK